MTDWKRIREAKELEREQLASLPLTQKFRLVDRLRERADLLRGERPSPVAVIHAPSSGLSTGLVESNATAASINLGEFGAKAVLFVGATSAFTTASTATTTVPIDPKAGK